MFKSTTTQSSLLPILSFALVCIAQGYFLVAQQQLLAMTVLGIVLMLAGFCFGYNRTSIIRLLKGCLLIVCLTILYTLSWQSGALFCSSLIWMAISYLIGWVSFYIQQWQFHRHFRESARYRNNEEGSGITPSIK